jgi:hypothetical protein
MSPIEGEVIAMVKQKIKQNRVILIPIQRLFVVYGALFTVV